MLQGGPPGSPGSQQSHWPPAWPPGRGWLSGRRGGGEAALTPASRGQQEKPERSAAGSSVAPHGSWGHKKKRVRRFLLEGRRPAGPPLQPGRAGPTGPTHPLPRGSAWRERARIQQHSRPPWQDAGPGSSWRFSGRSLLTLLPCVLGTYSGPTGQEDGLLRPSSETMSPRAAQPGEWGRRVKGGCPPGSGAESGRV